MSITCHLQYMTFLAVLVTIHFHWTEKATPTLCLTSFVFTEGNHPGSWMTWGRVNDRLSYFKSPAFKQTLSCFAWKSAGQLDFRQLQWKPLMCFVCNSKLSVWSGHRSAAIGEGRLLFTGSKATAFNDHCMFFKKKRPSCEVYCVSAAIYRGLSFVTKPLIKLGQRHRRYWQTVSQWTLGGYPERLQLILYWFFITDNTSGLWFNSYFYRPIT